MLLLFRAVSDASLALPRLKSPEAAYHDLSSTNIVMRTFPSVPGLACDSKPNGPIAYGTNGVLAARMLPLPLRTLVPAVL